MIAYQLKQHRKNFPAALPPIPHQDSVILFCYILRSWGFDQLLTREILSAILKMFLTIKLLFNFLLNFNFPFCLSYISALPPSNSNLYILVFKRQTLISDHVLFKWHLWKDKLFSSIETYCISANVFSYFKNLF